MEVTYKVCIHQCIGKNKVSLSIDFEKWKNLEIDEIVYYDNQPYYVLYKFVEIECQDKKSE